MRTTAKDLKRVIPLTTLNPVPSGASGNGIFQDGTSWHMVRTATGEYNLYFDSRLFPISGSMGSLQGARHFYFFEVAAPGQIRVQVIDFAGNAVNSTFDVTIMCLDTRV